MNRNDMKNIDHILISPDKTIRDAMDSINHNLKGIVLVVDDSRHLLGTITDGNIRRAILAGTPLETPIRKLLGVDPDYPRPVVARAGADRLDILGLMRQHKVRQLPLLDEEDRVVDLATLDDLLPESLSPMMAVVMAGGFGTRLRPLTENLPKPMLPVGGRPLMEHIIEGLREAGITQINVTTHYKSEVITDHFGDGRNFGVDIEYVTEDRPLGTAGALGLLKVPEQPFLVINGDILTRVDFKAMLAFHQEHDAALTVGVRQYDFKVPYGVVEAEGVEVRRITEKPVLNFFVNAGIYLLDPGTHRFIPNGQRLDMTELIDILLANGRRVVSFPICEYWLDVGQPDDYAQAQVDVNDKRD
ncbi:MAG: CBS domain-containing protein [Candidatus Latescibacteria bacterium]|nr:CBS domain-containing protein [Candidatus Latescibacterota bacterium]